MQEIRVYMAYNFPVDPTRIEIIPDMDLSYALGGTLIEWGRDKQLAAGLCDHWETIGDHTYRFVLRPGAKWSNGELVTSEQVKRSFERGFSKYPKDLRSLKLMLKSIEPRPNGVVDFILADNVAPGRLLQKLTEPNYDILYIDSTGEPNLKITTGAFSLSKHEKNELILERNPHWHNFSEAIAERVVVRRTPRGINLQTVLLDDTWPNIGETTSLIAPALLDRYKKEGFSIWTRPTDKIFLAELGKRVRNKKGFKLLQFLNQTLSKKELAEGLTGYIEAKQFFPPGYNLHDPDFKCSINLSPSEIKEFQGMKLEILGASERILPQMAENIKRAVKRATGAEPHLFLLPLQEAFKRRQVGDYDIYFGAYGLDDPDPEGAMSFYFDNENSVIPSGDENYVGQLDKARKEHDKEKRFLLMRKILSDSVCKGYVLPLFNYSTVAVGRPEIDFRDVPSSDETATLSKIRFKVGQ